MTTKEWMLVVLAIFGCAILITFWRAHRSSLVQFNLFDLLMENGRVSKIALAFMLVLAVTTWIVVYLTIQGKMTEGFFGAYGVMWVGPLVAKVIFNKTEAPSMTSTTTMTQQTTEIKP